MLRQGINYCLQAVQIGIEIFRIEASNGRRRLDHGPQSFVVGVQDTLQLGPRSAMLSALYYLTGLYLQRNLCAFLIVFILTKSV